MVGRSENLTSMPFEVSGRMGGVRSGQVRRQRAEIRSVASLVLGSKLDMPKGLGAEIRRAGISVPERLTVAAGILAVISARALEGDLKAARFLFEMAGQTPDAMERIAKADAMESMVRAGVAATPEGFALPSPEVLDAEAERMGVYG